MALETPEEFCRAVLPDVSRTFAVNIPVLPEPLDLVVTVAYLLCRIADTLEDEAQGPVNQRVALFAELSRLVTLPGDWKPRSEAFVKAARATLRPEAPASEVRLLEGTPTVLEAFAALPTWTHPPVQRCVQTMVSGMSEVTRELLGQRRATGTENLEAMLTYCYYVAGTVGEMLTGLFIEFAKVAPPRAKELEARAVAFGRALQLTNILKDIREDLERGSCWLPRDRLAAHGLSTDNLLEREVRERAVSLLNELVAVAREEADSAFEYCLLLPDEPSGLRLFCLWPLFFCVLTLRKLEDNPRVFESEPVKISREDVGNVVTATQENVGSDDALRRLYATYRNRLAAAA